MEKIVFDETLSVGVRKLDEQHQQLVKMINTLIEIESETLDSEEVMDLLNQMTAYADSHFGQEEQYMRDFNYQGYLSHKQEHIHFKKRTIDFLSAAKRDKQTLKNEITGYLRNWLVNHILRTDMKYKDFFSEKGLK